MKMRLLFYIIYLTISCTKQDIDNSKYVIDFEKSIEKTILMSDYFETVKTIIFEDESINLIGTIEKFEIYKNYIFILHYVEYDILSVYSKDGKFLRNIGTHGRGDGEYIKISDFTIDPVKENIYLLDSYNNCILNYNINNGLYLKSIYFENELSKKTANIQYFNNQIYIDNQYTHEQDSMFLISTIDINTGNIIHNYLDAYKFNYGYFGPFTVVGSYSLIDGFPKYHSYFTNIVFEITEEAINNHILFLNKDWVTPSDVVKAKEQNASLQYYMMDRKKSFNLENYIESSRFISFTFEQYKDFPNFCTILFDKSNNQVYRTSFIVDDILYKKPSILFKQLYHQDEKGLYLLINDYTLMKFLEQKENLKENIDKLNEIISMNESNNGIIFYYTFKD